MGEGSQKIISRFKYFDDLIHSGSKEIKLDCDISIDDSEKEYYLDGIEIDIDNLVIDGGYHSIDANIQDDRDPLVFISYSSYDKKIADEVCSFLKSHNVKCFILPRDVKGGNDIGEEIVDALKITGLVLLIFSKHSNGSS